MALIAQDHRETPLRRPGWVQVAAGHIRRAEYHLAWPQSLGQWLRNEYISRYCYYLDAQVIHAVLVFKLSLAHFLYAFRTCLSHCELYRI